MAQYRTVFMISTTSAQLVSDFYKTVIRASVLQVQSQVSTFCPFSTPDGEGNRADIAPNT